jgi:hypothetical protein
MRSSMDQVLDVVKGWRDDKRKVAVLLTSGKDHLVKMGGAVVEVGPVSLHVFGSDFGVDINLAVATDFDWQDPREAPAASRDEAVRLYDSFLEIRAPSYRCLLFAFKRKQERS